MSYSQQQLTQFAQTPEAQTVQEDIRKILLRSASDLEFRQQLMSDPRSALREEGHEIPAGFDIRFIENSHDATIVLPDVVDMEAELSEAELETVAGGVTTTFVCGVILTCILLR